MRNDGKDWLRRLNMFNLFTRFDQATQDLSYSLQEAGFNQPTVILDDDGFLPQGFHSPYQFFMGDDPNEASKGRFFNEIPVPKYWEISGSNSQAFIHDLNQKRANVFYAEGHKARIVKRVDWLEPNGKIFSTDCYNRKGRCYGRYAYDKKGQVITISYFDLNGQEVIVENKITGDIILNHKGYTYNFKSGLDFVKFYLKKAGFEWDHIYINSLANPFLISYYSQKTGMDTLFWQETIHEDIPGNMQLIFNQDDIRAQRVIVPNRDTYEKLIQLAPAEYHSKIDQLGYIYPFKKENKQQKTILILTNTDQIEQLDRFLSQMPDFQFYVAAVTEMSDKLMGYNRYPNIKLLPNATKDQIAELFNICDIYLDINHGSELLNAIRQAFEHNQLILGFEPLLHNRIYVAKAHRFEVANIDNMIGKIKSLFLSDTGFKAALADQKNQANTVTVGDYRKVLGG